MLYKNFKQHIPAAITGICCWVCLFIISGTLCLCRALLGFPCPGCGLSRAALELFCGNINRAVEYHPLIFVTFGLLAFFIAAAVLNINILKFKYADNLLFLIFLIYLSVYIVRIILFFPETEPMTYLETSVLGRIINFICNIYNTR